MKTENDIEQAKEWWAKNTPAGAVMAIIGTFEVDCSDPMSDYFNHRTERTILLGFSDSKRNNFAELRKAAANAEETRFLAEYNRSLENRDRAWYFLGKWSSGWQVKKASLGNLCVTDPNNIKLPKPAAITLNATEYKKQFPPADGKMATCRLNKAKGGVELYFPGKPAQEVLADLKANGFRWSRFNGCWYRADNSVSRRVAAKYAVVPAEEINQDAGLVDAQEQAAIANGNY